MSTDYSKLKNAELEALLKERQLPHNGKKAEMVARLTEHDQQHKPSSTTTAAPAPAPLDAAAAASSEPAAAALAAGGTATRAPNPVAVPNQAAAIDPAATADLSAAKDTTTSAAAPLESTEAAPAPAFTSNLNLGPTDIDAEIAKRKARAAKFGISEANDDAIKALERAKRFGTGTEGATKAGEEKEDSGALGMSKLDGALPERGGRKRGRGGKEDSWEDEGLKRRRGGGGPRGKGTGDRVEKREGRKGTPSWMTDSDRAAAEKRKAKFATASTAS